MHLPTFSPKQFVHVSVAGLTDKDAHATSLEATTLCCCQELAGRQTSSLSTQSPSNNASARLIRRLEAQALHGNMTKVTAMHLRHTTYLKPAAVRLNSPFSISSNAVFAAAIRLL